MFLASRRKPRRKRREKHSNQLHPRILPDDDHDDHDKHRNHDDNDAVRRRRNTKSEALTTASSEVLEAVGTELRKNCARGGMVVKNIHV